MNKSYSSRGLLVITSIMMGLAGCGSGSDGGTAPVPPPAPPPPVSNVTCTINYNFTNSPILTGTDPLLSSAWHLNNTGQSGGTAGEDIRAFGAWNTTKGLGARVAIVDDAIEITHEDLAPNSITGASYNYLTKTNSPLPCVADDKHGTEVAGLIVARDGNGIGAAGVAPRASFVGYNALSSNSDADVSDAMNRDGAVNQISHNSWGSPDNGFQNSSGPVWNAAIDSGIANGRGGKGTVYVFASGNGGQIKLPNDPNKAAPDNENYTTETSNLDGYVNRRGIISVCATNDLGKQPYFGENGTNLLVCSPSTNQTNTRGAPTTGIQNSYPTDFIGTSASAPIVSGVVALMLSANPNLTARDVPIILAQTARKNHTSFTATELNPRWTGTGIAQYSPRYGFGVVDANAAVIAAQSWVSVGNASTLKSCGDFSSSPNVAIPDAPASGAPIPISNIINVSASACAITKIEHVDVWFTSLDHAYTGDIRLRLISPSGAVSDLVDARSCGTGLVDKENPCKQVYNNWRFGSVRHMNEASNGAWKLEVTDMNNIDTGTFQNWKIKIWGR